MLSWIAFPPARTDADLCLVKRGSAPEPRHRSWYRDGVLPDTLLRPVTEDPIDLPDVQQDVAGVLEDDRTIAFDMLG
jgi:hypothetical protein